MKKLIMLAMLSGVMLWCSQENFATLTDDGNIIAEGGYDEAYEKNINELRNAVEKNDIGLIKQSLSNISDIFGDLWIFNLDRLLKDQGKEETIKFVFSEIEDWYRPMQKFSENAKVKNHISCELYASAIITKLIDRYGNSPWFISNLEKFVTHTKNVVTQATEQATDQK